MPLSKLPNLFSNCQSENARHGLVFLSKTWFYSSGPQPLIVTALLLALLQHCILWGNHVMSLKVFKWVYLVVGHTDDQTQVDASGKRPAGSVCKCMCSLSSASPCSAEQGTSSSDALVHNGLDHSPAGRDKLLIIEVKSIRPFTVDVSFLDKHVNGWCTSGQIM